MKAKPNGKGVVPHYCWPATLYTVEQCFGFVPRGGGLLDALAMARRAG
jgi:hypothetical protein